MRRKAIVSLCLAVGLAIVAVVAFVSVADIKTVDRMSNQQAETAELYSNRE